jgi:hypothetical protein
MPYRSRSLARLVQDDHTNAVTDLEDRVAADAFGRSETAFEELIRRTLTAWTRAFGVPSQAAVPGDVLRRLLAAARAAVRRILDGVADRAPRVLAGALGEAVELGVVQGLAFVRAASGRSRTAAVPQVRRLLADEARWVADVVRERRDRALFLLHPDRSTRWTHVLAGLGAARAVLPAVRSHISWVLNTAVRDGLDAVARATAPLRLWVSEADACVRCLAYTGRTSPVGVPFPGGLSWDPRQRRVRAGAVDGPPLHGHCRCRTVPWNKSWTADGTLFPEALRREAHRNIAYGRARPSESRAARLRAVRELLRVEPNLLPAVESRARTALRTGRFTTAA